MVCKSRTTKSCPSSEQFRYSVRGLGKGVDQNDLQAYKWLSLASINGYDKAKAPLEKLAKALPAEQRAQAEALTQAWLKAYH